MKRKAQTEMRQLFGDPVVYMAGITDPASLSLSPELMHSVQEAAESLLKNRGKPSAQRGSIVGLSFTVRLALCMWLTDVKLAAKLIRVAYA